MNEFGVELRLPSWDPQIDREQRALYKIKDKERQKSSILIDQPLTTMSSKSSIHMYICYNIRHL
jgi:hypothetical protein